MPFSFERIKRTLQQKYGEKEASVILSPYEGLVHMKKPSVKSKMIGSLIVDLENAIGIAEACKVLELCGEQCLGASVMRKAKQLYNNATTMNDFISSLNEHHIGGGFLSIENGKIHIVYKKCYCGAVSRSEYPVSITYCNCSRGWLKTLFMTVLSQEVEVIIKDSIIHGAKECYFEVTLGELEIR